jgi:hypothetical protein
MEDRDEIELSREQHRAAVAVDVLRLVNPGDRETMRLYRMAVETLEAYLEPAVPDPDERFDP